jgi:hypothetical protein
MAGDVENGAGRRGSRWRIVAWSAAGLLLLLPLVAMQFTEEVDWGVGDFVIFGSLLVAAGVTFELVVRKTGDWAYRCAVGLAIAAAFILVWVNGAVGIIGNEQNDANMMYGGVLGIGIIARLRPGAMARALCATAVAQALVGVIAVSAGLGSAGPIWPWGIVLMTAFFTALWLVSAGLFQKAAGQDTNRIDAGA